jgi:hypothetical protein
MKTTILLMLCSLILLPSALAVPVPRAGNFTWKESEYFQFMKGRCKHGRDVAVYEINGTLYFDRAGKRCRF